METGYYDTHFVNVLSNICTGLMVPGLKNSGFGFRLYCMFLLSIDLIIFLLYGIQMVQMNNLIRICMDFIGDCTVLYGLFISIYLVRVTRSFKDLLTRFDELTLACLNDPLDPEKTFHKRLISNYKFVRMYSLIGVPYTAFSSVAFFAVNIIRSSSILGMDGKKIISVDIWIPNTNKSPNYEIAQLMGMTGILVSATQKQAMECFVLSLLALLTTYLDHLKMTVSNIFVDNSESVLSQNNRISFIQLSKNDDGNEPSIRLNDHVKNSLCSDKCMERNLKSWIKIHQKTLSLCRELINLLSPLLAFYLVNIIALVAVTVFTVTFGEIAFIEYVCLFYYSSTTGFTLYLLCYYGNQLILKSADVIQPAFWKCFLLDKKSSKEVLSSLRIIFQRALSPLIVSPFRSNSFELSLVSFVSFVKSIISFYLAITKIKEVV